VTQAEEKIPVKQVAMNDDRAENNMLKTSTLEIFET